MKNPIKSYLVAAAMIMALSFISGCGNNDDPELSAKDKQIEQCKEFVKCRRKHSAVESSINALENHGLDRCLDHGLHGFERYVALAVLARNIQMLGHLIQQKELKKKTL